jgi:hypothetical protein
MITCDRFLDILDDYVDGRLPAPARAAADEHLGHCDGCRNQLHILQDLLRRAAELPASEEPPRDLWPGIESHLRSDARRVVAMPGRRPPWLAPILAVAAVVLMTVATVALLTRSTEVGPTHADRDAASTTDHPEVRAAYSDVESDIHRLRGELRATLEQRRGELSPATWQVVTENLQVIDEAIHNIELALADQPDNPELNRMLLAAYRSELDLLRRVAELPADAVLS